MGAILVLHDIFLARLAEELVHGPGSTISLTAMRLQPNCPVPTYQRPLPDADPHTVDCTGGELGPVGELTVVLAGQLTRLRDAGHGLGEFQTLRRVSLRPVELEAGQGWKDRGTEAKRLHDRTVSWKTGR